MPPPATCCACGADALVPGLRVAPPVPAGAFAPSTREFGAALSDLLRCGACGHQQLERMPSEVVLGEAYGATADDEYVGEEVGQRATAARLLARLEAHVEGRRLLDLGCWVGFLLAEAGRRGWQATGVEPSQWAVDHARSQLGVDVVHGELLTARLPGPSYDAVVMADVIEHLPDPAAGLDRVRRLVAPGGALLLVLPDAGSRVARLLGRRWWSVIPTHVQYFTRRSMVALLERCGWQVVEVRTAPKAFSAGYYLGRLSGYSPSLGRLAVGAGRRTGVADRLVTPDFRDRMLVVAVPRAG